MRDSDTSTTEKGISQNESNPSATEHTRQYVVRKLRGIASAPGHVGAYAVDDQSCGSNELNFPRVEIGMQKGYCLGIVASADDGLITPRSIVQIHNQDKQLFVISDLANYGSKGGKVWLLDPQQPPLKRLKVLLSGLDNPQGLAIGPDHLVYVGLMTKIVRFNPLAANPSSTLQDVIDNLPGPSIKWPDGSMTKNNHPYKQFIFDKLGNIYLNIGAPTDNCAQTGAPRACVQSSGTRPGASIWMFHAPANHVFPTLHANGVNPKMTVYATGLRNSMALAVHPTFPNPGSAMLQAENARDLPDPNNPSEELNLVLPGRNYGWPYCYNRNDVAPEFRTLLSAKGTSWTDFCNSKNYRQPLSLLPPHAAPLGMIYYMGDRFPDLKDHWIVTLHGYMPTGSRVISIAGDPQTGVPTVEKGPHSYNLNCDEDASREFKSATGAADTSGVAYQELVSHWFGSIGMRPQGTPTGITQADDGAIWIVEDKNKTILRMDAENTQIQPVDLACNARSKKEVEQLVSLVTPSTDPNAPPNPNIERLHDLRKNYFERYCTSCHADAENVPEAQKDLAMARLWFSREGWIYPGDPDSSRLHRRTRGTDGEGLMPKDGTAQALLQDPNYIKMLNKLDNFILTLVPGEIYTGNTDRSPVLLIDNERTECARIPSTGTSVIVINKDPSINANSATKKFQIYSPADKYLNGYCDMVSNYYVPQDVVRPAPEALLPE